MFTGIIESTGIIREVEKEGTNNHLTVEAPFANELVVNQSVSHNGVCLTVTKIESGTFKVTAVQETLKKSNIGELDTGDLVNLERSMATGYRFDGHIVQGHVDQVGFCTRKEEVGGSWLFDFEYDSASGNFTIEKGSICIDGISLTVFNCAEGRFTVTIIPHTYEVTNFKRLEPGKKVNLEFDVVGKYIQRLFSLGYAENVKNKLK